MAVGLLTAAASVELEELAVSTAVEAAVVEAGRHLVQAELERLVSVW